MKLLTMQVARFGIVGGLSMATHLLIVIILVEFELHPLLANVIAFIGAFQISYRGHASWTFHSTSNRNNTSMIRFLGVALTGFFLNEALFAALLEWTDLPYYLALTAVLFLIAGLTFIFSKFWAFRPALHPGS